MLRLDSSELLVENEINRQKELIQSVKDAPSKLPVVQKAVEDERKIANLDADTLDDATIEKVVEETYFDFIPVGGFEIEF